MRNSPRDHEARVSHPHGADHPALSWAEEIANLLSQGLITPAEVAGISDEELEVVALSCEQALRVQHLAEAACLAQGLTTLAPYLPWGWKLAAQTYQQAGLTEEAGLAESIAEALGEGHTAQHAPTAALAEALLQPSGAGMADPNDVLEPWLEPSTPPPQDPADVFTLGSGRALPLPASKRPPPGADWDPDAATAPGLAPSAASQNEVTAVTAPLPEHNTKTFKGPHALPPQPLEQETTVTAVVRRRRGWDFATWLES